MHEIDLRSVTFTCTPFEGNVFETSDINLINYPMGRNLFRVNEILRESVSVNGIDVREVQFVGATATGRIIPTQSVNSITFSEDEGIYYIDNIPCQKVTLTF